MSGKMRALLMIAIGVAVIGLASAAILFSRTDSGFMRRSCFAEGPVSELHWDSVAIPVVVRLPRDERHLKDAVHYAISYWNRLGLLFQWGGFIEDGEIVDDPVVVVQSHSEMEGRTRLLWNAMCNIRRVYVTLPPREFDTIARCVAAHEFGHALGLDEDDDEDSVMSPHRGIRFNCTVSENDRRLLKERYLTP